MNALSSLSVTLLVAILLMAFLSSYDGAAGTATPEQEHDVTMQQRRNLVVSNFKCPDTDICGTFFFGLLNQFGMVLEDCANPLQCQSFICTKFPFIERLRGFECDSLVNCGVLCKLRMLFEKGPLDHGGVVTIQNDGGDETKQVNHRRMNELVEELNGNMTAGLLIKEEILNPKHFPVLKDYVDKKFREQLTAGVTMKNGVSIQEDFILLSSPAALKDLIGMDAFVTLYEAFKENNPEYPVTRVDFRRTNFVDEHHLDWHIDGPNAVMHVFFNEDEVQGGNYLFWNENGLTEVETKSGSGIVHSHNVVHSIAHFTGMRYHILFVSDNINGHDYVLDMFKEEATTFSKLS